MDQEGCMKMKHYKELTKENFKDEILNKSKLSVIDFWASWCGPCQMLAPVFESVSEEFEDVDFYKVNADSEPDLVMQFGVKSIPTLAFIKDNKTVDISIGLISKEELLDFIKRNK